MKAATIIAALAALALSSAGAQTLALATQSETPAWRQDTTNLASDRAAIVRCLAGTSNYYSCVSVVQEACVEALPQSARTDVARQRCEWRAIAAWEDEGEATAVALRAALPADRVGDVDWAQKLWRQAMAADVGLAANVTDGSNTLAAEARARATARRAVYLRDRVRQLELR